ncbi:MAG: hypothetical protein IKV44_05770 [Clostridia bacterium]|nr:hypothetical protein [Clostridia bacterium]
MEKEILNVQDNVTEAVESTPVVENEAFYAEGDSQPASAETAQQEPAKVFDFKFFRNCAASLKKFSVLIFVINLFISLGITGAVTVLLAVNLGAQMLSLLALPIVTLLIILIVLSRFASALIYGFAEIVEKAEKN